MKVIVYGWHTDIYPKDQEVFELCKPGKGEDTCSWLVMGPKGWECCCLHKPHPFVDRRERKEMVAMRNGCDEVNGLNVMALGGGTHDIDVLNA